MRIAAIGVGGAGGDLVESLWRDDERRQHSYLTGACAVDTDTDALRALHRLPAEYRHSFGLFETDGNGTDGDRTTGIAAIDEDRLEVRRAIDPLVTSTVDAIVLLGGLAGGTGGGAMAHIADSLGEIYDRPIYAVGILPAGDDVAAATNTLQALEALSSPVDGVILFDNDAWLGSGETVADSAESLNETLTTRLGALFAAGEATDSNSVGESVVDASEIINTLSGPGYATIGYGHQTLETPETEPNEGLLDRLRNRFSSSDSEPVDSIRSHKAVETTLRRAVRGKLTVECTLSTADSALCVFAGPPTWLSRAAISDGCRWLQEELSSAEIRSGDMPTPERSVLSVLALFSGVTQVSRLDELRTAAQ